MWKVWEDLCRSHWKERPAATPLGLAAERIDDEIDGQGVLHHEYNIEYGLEAGRYRRKQREHQSLRIQLGKPLSVPLAAGPGYAWTGTVYRLCAITNTFIERHLTVDTEIICLSNHGLCTDVIPVNEIRLVRIRQALQNDGTPLHCVSHLISPSDHYHHDPRVRFPGLLPEKKDSPTRDGKTNQYENQDCVLDIKTSEVGLNSGRCFTLKTDVHEDLVNLEKSLITAREEALKIQRSNHSFMRNMIIVGRRFKKSTAFHRWRVLMIGVSFLLCVTEVSS